MQGRKVDAILDAPKHFIGDYDRMGEALATMHDSMADCVDVGNTLYLSNT